MKHYKFNEVLEMRTALVKKYGRKIITHNPDRLNVKEKEAQDTYYHLTKVLHDRGNLTFNTLDWLIETTSGRLLTQALIIIGATLVAYNTNDYFLKFIGYVGSLYFFIKIAITLTRIGIMKLWKATEP